MAISAKAGKKDHSGTELGWLLLGISLSKGT
jgi:hypothetical protein